MGKRTNTAKWMEKQNRWQINVQKDTERRSFYSSTTGRTGQRECNAKADAWLDDGITGDGTRITTLFDAFIDDLKDRTSISNWRGEEARGKNWIKPEIGTLKISSLTEQHLQNIINKAYKHGLSKKSLSNLRATLFALIKYCRKCKATTLFPENVVIPKGAAEKGRVILQPENLVTLFTVDTTVFKGKRIYDEYINAYRFQALTGLRPGEILGLMWNDIKDNTVHIRRSINIYGETTTGKNRNALRSFALYPTASALLENQRKQSDSDYVFPIFKEHRLRSHWQRYCLSNGLPKMTPYEMRHTFVSMIQDLPESQVKALVGHSRNMDTFGTYRHVVNGKQEQTANSIENIFKELLKSPE